MPAPFLVACQFLTTVPIRFAAPPSVREQGASLAWFGAVGLILGGVLALIAWLAAAWAPPLVAAALVLAGWVIATGALHLDGLGDSADAMMGASRAEAFAIMKDPRAGSMAVAAIAVVLLAKFAAIAALIGQGHFAAVAAAPLVARVGAQALFLTTPAAREDGLAATLAAHADRQPVLIALVVGLAAAALLLGFSSWLVLPLAAVVFIAVRALMMRKLLGTTGDSAGALVEILETAVLVLAV